MHPQLLNEEGHQGNAKTQLHSLDPSPVPSLRAGGRECILRKLESVLMSGSPGPPSDPPPSSKVIPGGPKQTSPTSLDTGRRGKVPPAHLGKSRSESNTPFT